MATSAECVCCQEITVTSEKIVSSESNIINCITQHEGFKAVCLNVGLYKPATLPTDITMGHVMQENLKMSKL